MASPHPIRVEPDTAVMIDDGPFKGMTAFVTEVWSGEETVKLTLTIFARPIEIDFSPVILRSPDWPRIHSWPEGTSLHRMLGCVSPAATDRQLRQFAAACCRRIRHLMVEERFVQLLQYADRFGLLGEISPCPTSFLLDAVELVDRRAEGEDLSETLDITRNKAAWLAGMQRSRDPSEGPPERGLSVACETANTIYLATSDRCNSYHAALSAARAVYRERGGDLEDESDDAVDPDETAAQRDLVRDIFGRPLRLEAADPAWLTPSALRLARGVYDDRDFGLMPILGDALEDAGCADEAVLSHLRADKPHARGCWVLDLLLGR
jgi:hypothetical protein